jgi:hypothetical protein
MNERAAPVFAAKTIDALEIDDERSFQHVGLYADLKEILRRDGYSFRVLPASLAGRWDRALLLNLTFWGSGAGGDVLESARIPADVVAHAAWHHLAARALSPASGAAGAAQSAEALFLGEAIASAFDVYLVGRLLGHAPQSSFLESQVPAMAEAAEAAGLSDEGFEVMLEGIAGDPDGAFEDLRALLVDATNALCACKDADDALVATAAFDAHRFAPILHRYELSNWVLYARAYANATPGPDAKAAAVDRTLRAQGAASIEWLTTNWVTPAIA